MKDFDAVRKAREEATRDEREFVFGGETFTARSTVRPEVLARWNQINEDTDPTTVLEVADGLVIDLIETDGDAHERYRALRQREDDAVGLPDLTALVEWLVEVQTGRDPTSPPSDSSPSPEPTGTTSTDDSSSEDTPTEPPPST